MLKGKYLNPKYSRRKKRRRRATLVAATLFLLLLGSLWVWRVDETIRSTMLPAAPPVAALTQQAPHRYQLSLLGRELAFSLEGMAKGLDELDQLLRTPPASVRLFYQLRAFATGALPRNAREDPRPALAG